MRASLQARLVALMKKRTRVYILPTRMGGYLNGLIFLMFLLSVGYNNNLLLIFTLVLFAFNLIWVIQTHTHLRTLKLENFRIEDGHANSRTLIQLSWKKKNKLSEGWQLELHSERDHLKITNLEINQEQTSGEVVLPYRGFFTWKYLKVATELPFGLYQVWIYFPLKAKSYSFPELLKNYPLPERRPLDFEGERTSSTKGTDGVHFLSPYTGEESRRISWKHYARSGELFIKEGETLRHEILDIEVKLPQDQKSRESYLSEVATSLVYCHSEQIPFTFKGLKFRGPGHHTELLKDCLKELALC